MAAREGGAETNLVYSGGYGEDTVDYNLRRFQYLLDIQKLWAVEWQELADYVLPRKNSILVRRTPGAKRTQKVFDSTAIRATELLAASMHGTLTPSWLRWFYIETDDDDLNEMQDCAEWLDNTGLTILAEFNKSNFDSEIHETYLDLIVFGTASLWFDEAPAKAGKFGGFLFSSVPIGRYAVAEGPDGRVNTFYRSWTMSAESIRMRWKDEANSADLDTLNPDYPYDVIHCVRPATNGTGIVNQFKWTSEWFLYKQRKILEQKGYFEFPVMCPRWSKVNGETYGRGPTHTAIPDIRSLNKIKELELKATAKTIDPPMKQLAGDVVGPIRLVPGGNTTVRNMEGLAPLLQGIDFKVSNLKSEELRNSIREIYYSDQLQLHEGPQMTAEEVRVRYELMQRVLGPALGRFEVELLKPLIDRAFNVCKRANLLPPIPPSMLQALQTKSIQLKIRYEGPLARAQKSADISSVQALIQTMSGVMQAKPEVMDIIDWDGIFRDAATTLGVAPKNIRDINQVNQIRQQQVQAQQQQNAPEQMAGAAKQLAPMVRAAGQKPEQGSPMANLMQNVQARNGNVPPQATR